MVALGDDLLPAIGQVYDHVCESATYQKHNGCEDHVCVCVVEAAMLVQTAWSWLLHLSKMFARDPALYFSAARPHLSTIVL